MEDLRSFFIGIVFLNWTIEQNNAQRVGRIYVKLTTDVKYEKYVSQSAGWQSLLQHTCNKASLLRRFCL
jgi:hypothetical protein